MEKELKLKLLHKEDYQKIADAFKDECEIVLQKNYYYDTDKMHLLRNDSVLRARVEKETVIMTFKTLKEKKNGYFISNEKEELCFYEDFSGVLSGAKHILDLCPGCKPDVVGITGSSELKLIGMIESLG